VEGEVTIDTVEVIGELDAGSNFIESVTVAPTDAAPIRSAQGLLADEPTPVTLSADEELVVAFERLIAVDALAIGANDSSRFSARCVDAEGETHDVALTSPAAEDDGPASHLREVAGG